MKKTMLILCLLSASLNVSALQTFSDPFKVNDVVGKFAEVGYVGPYATTKTVNEAHLACMGSMSVGSESSTGDISSFSDAYKTCMAQYVPFKKAGAGESNACAMETVSWGECSGVAQATPDGTSVSIKNTLGLYEGYATFQCSGGSLIYQSGGCAKVVDTCEEGKIAQWPVTSPLWADPSSSTVYVDKYGQFRNTPKPQCQARMSASPSGQLHFPNPTPAELYDPARYDISASSSPQRCFNNEWLYEPGAGVSSCVYVPKTCAAKTVDYKGCGFSLPSGAHDSVFVAKNPTPQNSTGSMEAYCWDGEWEVKSSSCQLSCDQNILANQWQGGDPKSCAHAAVSQSQRIRPGLNVLVANETAGMNGNISYLCENGTLKESSKTCEPKSCNRIGALSWGDSCNHAEITGSTWQHGQTFTVSSYTDLFVAAGEATYQCVYGGLASGEDGSMDLVGTPSCGGSEEPLCKNDPTNPPSDCSGGVIVSGICCSRAADGSVNCGTIDPPDIVEDGKSYGPWGDWVNVGDVKACSAWTPDVSTVPQGQLFTAQRKCKQDQERSRDEFMNFSDGTKQKIGVDTEAQTVDVSQHEARIGEQVKSVDWTSKVGFYKDYWNNQKSGFGRQEGDIVMITIDGTEANRAYEQGYASWTSGICPTCFISDVFLINGYGSHNQDETYLEFPPKEKIGGGSFGVVAIPLPTKEGATGLHRSGSVDMRFTISDAAGNSVTLEVYGVSGSSYTCLVTDWTGCK